MGRVAGRVGARYRVAALAILVAAAGCAGDGPAPAVTSGVFDELQQDIFDQNCLSAGCHNAQSRAGNLNLSAGASYDQLVGHAPDNPSAEQAGLQRVTPFDPQDSFLMVKLVEPGAGEGSRMPQGQSPLSPADIERIRAWIADGAPRGDATAAPTETATLTATPTLESPTATPSSPPTVTQTSGPTRTGTLPRSATSTSMPTETPTPSATPSRTLNPDATLAEIRRTIFDPTCAVVFCHDSTTQSGDLVLEDGTSYAELVNVDSFQGAAHQAGLKRVAPGDPDNSFLVIKIEGPPLVMGSRMPLIGLPLTAAQIQLVRDWIAQGAAP